MPFIGEQPTQASNFNVAARAGAVSVTINAGTFTVTTRAGSVDVGVV
jgi:hypothetical protein